MADSIKKLDAKKLAALQLTFELGFLPSAAYDGIFGSASNCSEQLKWLCEAGLLTSLPDPVRRPGRPSLYYAVTAAAYRWLAPFSGPGSRPPAVQLTDRLLLEGANTAHTLEVGTLACAWLTGLDSTAHAGWHGEASGRMVLAADNSGIPGTYVEPDGVLLVGGVAESWFVEHDRGTEHRGKWVPKLQRYTRLAAQPAAWARYGPQWPGLLITCLDPASILEIAGYWSEVAQTQPAMTAWTVFFAVYQEVATKEHATAPVWQQLLFGAAAAELSGEQWTLAQVVGMLDPPERVAPARALTTVAPPPLALRDPATGVPLWTPSPPVTLRLPLNVPPPAGVAAKDFYVELPPGYTAAHARAQAVALVDVEEASAAEEAELRHRVRLLEQAVAEEKARRQAERAEQQRQETARQARVAAAAEYEARRQAALQRAAEEAALETALAERAAAQDAANMRAYLASFPGIVAVFLAHWEPLINGFLAFLWTAVWLREDADARMLVQGMLIGGPAPPEWQWWLGRAAFWPVLIVWLLVGYRALAYGGPVGRRTACMPRRIWNTRTWVWAGPVRQWGVLWLGLSYGYLWLLQWWRLSQELPWAPFGWPVGQPGSESWGWLRNIEAAALLVLVPSGVLWIVDWVVRKATRPAN